MIYTISCTSFLGLLWYIFTNWWLKTIVVYSLIILEVRSLKSRHWQCQAASEDSRKESFFASSKLLVFASNSYILSSITPFLPPSSSGCLLCVYLCLHMASWKGRQSLDLGYTLIHYDLILTWLHLFQIRSLLQFLDEHEVWGVTIQPTACQRINFHSAIKDILMI